MVSAPNCMSIMGGPYSNAQLTFILGSLGIVEIHAPVRDGAGRAYPSLEALSDIAEALGVSMDRLINQSVLSLIDTTKYIEELDSVILAPTDYLNMERIARCLKMNPRILIAALARQDPPIPDDHERGSAYEDFAHRTIG